MHSLYYLDLSYNKLKHLPESLGKISELETLLLEGNEIQDLPSFEAHDMLMRLNLNDNNLTKLDFDISLMEDLQILTLDNNKLEYLPTTICKLKNLNHLSISANNLQSLPECFGELENLIELDIEENEISELPSSFSNLKRLKVFYKDEDVNLNGTLFELQ